MKKMLRCSLLIVLIAGCMAVECDFRAQWELGDGTLNIASEAGMTAWMKYRVSVQRPAWSSVTTRSPASPVKPLSHRTCFQRSAGYSLQCGSPPVISTASQFLDLMSPRSLSILCR